ncbi:2-C-methyl-D-erythritol 4-phosphate cytidylyltransferase [Brumimicrobium aurantiacum]|uniref:2-C-methyl-D-erythritol 4-phosphate cytidylyltransferase n=1 Tax=Brumimicrobium aurantiacum TaxID=1737063 RepID=A0A3E1EVH2_9FLAO|nr:2-C-methyl-D-erythritol 4-phosphate cytidylyltransferase [Brumimicrobium aurantiacum]RFC53561.1 2-C-methyl-D-erythritol 4-phosphate cytidylyltransferase [Brumimicrobium aurantiacum]
MKKSVIITAGGIGKRMGSDLPKQYLEVCGLPILMHTINRFYDYDKTFEIIISLPSSFIGFWKELCQKHGFEIPHSIVEGGKERYHSIQNALKNATGEIVLVHDAVRPLVNDFTIENVINKAIEDGAAVPVLPIKSTLRKGTKNESKHIDRANYWEVQTPQAFRAEILREAYLIEFSSKVTDDASLVEASGKKVQLTEGNEENIKITTPFDLKLVEFFMKK